MLALSFAILYVMIAMIAGAAFYEPRDGIFFDARSYGKAAILGISWPFLLPLGLFILCLLFFLKALSDVMVWFHKMLGPK
jgi:hypothetical protein